MSVGTAILIVGVLALIVWQIDKRGAWRKAGKVILWCILTLALIVGAIGGYVYFDDWQAQRKEAEAAKIELDALRSAGLTEYFGIEIGMTESEVRYVLGNPKIHDTSPDGAVWKYKEEYADDFRAVFFLDGHVDQLQCGGTYRFDCPSLAGITIGDSEAEVMQRVGSVLGEPNLLDDGRKFVTGGSTKGRLLIGLSRGRVSILGVIGTTKAKVRGTAGN